MREIAQQLNQVLRDAIEQSRNLSHELSPPVLHQSDLSDTFEWLAGQIRAKHGMAVETDIYGQVDSQSESIKTFLYRAAQEILFNTVKHAGVEEARLRLRRKGQQLWLAIADRGKGFDPTDLGKAAGFGLLSIRERVGLLGGRMKIRSVPGKGSVFAIAVPDVQIAREAERAGKTERPVAYVAPTSRVRRAVSGDRLRVLLVDDHKVVREGLAALIGEEEDMQVVGQAGDGSEAIERARELQPDVIIMDVSMPVMAGDEATRRIKAEMRHMRVIALSMFEEHSVGERMLDAGAELYLPKAGPSERLLAAIRGSNLTS